MHAGAKEGRREMKKVRKAQKTFRVLGWHVTIPDGVSVKMTENGISVGPGVCDPPARKKAVKA